MLRRLALVRTDVLEELSASIIRMTRIGELIWYFLAALQLLVTANVVLNSLIGVTLMMEALVPPTCRSLQGPHGVTSQKTVFFIPCTSVWKRTDPCRYVMPHCSQSLVTRLPSAHTTHTIAVAVAR
jgi:hypothetical protein